MSMWEPMTPNRYRPDDEIAAADPGAGAPPPAEGFGVGGEEPDRPEQAEGSPAAADGADTVFRTPDPTDVRRDPGA